MPLPLLVLRGQAVESPARPPSIGLPRRMCLEESWQGVEGFRNVSYARELGEPYPNRWAENTWGMRQMSASDGAYHRRRTETSDDRSIALRRRSALLRSSLDSMNRRPPGPGRTPIPGNPEREDFEADEYRVRPGR